MSPYEQTLLNRFAVLATERFRIFAPDAKVRTADTGKLLPV